MINDHSYKAPERLNNEPSPENLNQQSHKIEENDLRIEAGIDAGSLLEGIDDGGEMVDSLKMSESGENVGEHRRATGRKFGDFKKKMTKQEADDLKKKLLKDLPSSKTMIKEIRAHVRQEIKHLEREAARVERSGKFRELSDTVSRMRELKIMLFDLLHSTAEMIKNLWLKVVHGIV